MKKLIVVVTAIATLSIGSPAWAAAHKPAPKPPAQKNQCYGRENLAATSAADNIQYGPAWLSPSSTWSWAHVVLALPWDYVYCTSSGPTTVSSLTQPFVVHWTVRDIARQPVYAALVAGSQTGNGFAKVWAHAHWARVLPGKTVKLVQTTTYEQGYVDNYFIIIRLTVVPKPWAGYTMWVNDNVPFNVALKRAKL